MTPAQLPGPPGLFIDPFLGFQSRIQQAFEIAGPERGTVFPVAFFVPERPGKGGEEKTPVLSPVLPDCGFDTAGADGVCRF